MLKVKTMKMSRYAMYDIQYNLVFILADGNLKGNEKAISTILREVAGEHEMVVGDVRVFPEGVYLEVIASPNHSPQLIVNWLKGISAKRFNSPKFPGEGHIKWRRKYCISTHKISPEEILKKLGDANGDI